MSVETFSSSPVIERDSEIHGVARQTRPSIGVLLTNLGTPDAPTASAVKRYLAEFLSDPRVVELPRILWIPLLRGLILPLRAKRSAQLYQKIWDQGSPLLQIAQRQAEKLGVLLKQTYQQAIPVVLGMRYGNPSIEHALQVLRQQNVDQIVVLPLYPQYASATVGSTWDAVSRVVGRWRHVPTLHFIHQYADHPQYIQALVNRIRRHWQMTEAGERLVFSFHGLPERSIAQGDPYYDMCHKTASLVAERLGYPSEKWLVVFQSRFGWQRWLQPYCDETLRSLAKQGIRRVDIMCPGFSADCLETLEEIVVQNRELYLAAGGCELNYIPALNDDADHIALMAELVGIPV